jgi:hypothetical protein
VAAERRVSIEDPDMRHGRKSKSKLFNGYKRQVAIDLDTKLILAGALLPANRPEGEALPLLKDDIDRMKRRIAEAHIDRGYIASPIVDEVLAGGGEVICKPWVPRNGKLFTKADFKINMRDMTITCPAGEVERIDLGADVEFDADACDECPLRAQCTNAAPGTGAPSRSPATSTCSTDSASSSPRGEVASDCASASRSSTASLTSAAGKDAAPVTAARGRICSTCAAQRPCRIWRRSTADSRQPKVRRSGRQRDDIVFKPFGVLEGAAVVVVVQTRATLHPDTLTRFK